MMPLKLPVVFITVIFLGHSAASQCRKVTLSENGGTATGESCKRKMKSSYSGSYEVEIKTGIWTYLNEDGVLFKRGGFKEEGETSFRSGIWEWFDESGKVFLKVEFASDRPVKIMAVDSGIAIWGDDSAWVYKPDSLHYKMHFSMKGKHQQWTMEKPGEWFDYDQKKSDKPAYKPIVGIIGKNEEQADAGGSSEQRENIIWSDGEMLELFPQVQKIAVSPMALVSQEQNIIVNATFQPKGKPLKNGKFVLTPGLVPGWTAAALTPDIHFDGSELVLGFLTTGANYEVVKGTINAPLEADKYYCFSMQVKLKKNCVYALNRIGVCLSDKDGSKMEKEAFGEMGITLVPEQETPICLRDSWMTIEGRFKANGGERFMYFGHFSDESNLKFWPLDSIFSGTMENQIYYFLRKPVLVPALQPDMCICNLEACPEPEAEPPQTEEVAAAEAEIKVDTFVLASVQFNTGKWELLETAFDALDSLAEYLLEHENYTIEITGHTDDQGKPADNLNLSEKRAKAVFKYLEKKGIATKRMSYTGKGDTEPIDDNADETGRERNRRVEFRIRKNQE